jgi:PPOX class probable F420-dependent enzyme
VTGDEALERAASARIARLATVRRDGSPHVVPVVFTLDVHDDRATVYWAVDAKPKRSTRLVRIENLRANPAAELVVDAYDEDWSRLWWVRLRGRGRVVESAAERKAALDALAEKYRQYASARPDGDVVAIDVTDVAAWAADDAIDGGAAEP